MCESHGHTMEFNSLMLGEFSLDKCKKLADVLCKSADIRTFFFSANE